MLGMGIKMNEFLTVFGYTFKENIRKRIFIISTIITLFLTVIILCVPAAINYFEDNGKSGIEQNSQQEKIGTVYVIDSKDVLRGSISMLGQSFEQYDFKLVPNSEMSKIKEMIKSDSSVQLVVLYEKKGIPYFDYLVKQNGNGLSPDELSKTVKEILVTKLLKSANVPDGTSKIVLADVESNVVELGKGMMKSYISCIIIIMLMYFLVYFYGYGVSMSVASEKTSRVMELLITSTKPSKIILGKSAAMGLLGLCQFVMILIVSAVTYKLSFPKDFTFAGQQLDFSSFTPLALIMIIVYFILGYSLYAMLNAVAGATVSKAEDVNSAVMPISLITLVAFYFAYATIAFPEGGIAVVSSIIPFSAPFSMPCRLLMSDVPAWQIIASVTVLILTIAFATWISVRIYSSAVLHYGKRLKVKDLVKMTNKL